MVTNSLIGIGLIFVISVANAALDDYWGDWVYLHTAGADTSHAWNGWSWQAGGPPTREAIVDYPNIGTDNWGSGFSAPLVGPKTAGDNVVCQLIRVNRGWFDANAIKEFEVNGGSLTLQVTEYPGSGLCIIGEYGKGLAKVSAGTFTADEIWVGGTGEGMLVVDGVSAVVNVGTLHVPYEGWSTGKGTVNLIQGTINATSSVGIIITNSTSLTGVIDIQQGQLVMQGDMRDLINSYVAQKWIKGYGGDDRSDIVVSYNPLTNRTTVTATPMLYAWNPSPTNDSVIDNPNIILTWSPGVGALSYNVYLGTDYNAVWNANTNSPQFKGNTDSPLYDPPGQLAAGTYYWRVDQISGSQVYKGRVWSFDLENYEIARNPIPVNDAAYVSVNPTLSWTPGENALSHDIYLGTDLLQVVAADRNSPLYRGNLPAYVTTYLPTSLTSDTVYYWRIDEITPTGVKTGYVWNFTTADLNDPIFECDSFAIAFDGSGYVSNLYYKPKFRQLITSASGNEGFLVYNDGLSKRLDSVYKLSDGSLLAATSDRSQYALFAISINNKHISFRLNQVYGMPTTSNVKMQFSMSPSISNPIWAGAIPAVYGDGVGVGMLPLDWMLDCYGGFVVKWEYLWHRDISPSPLGGFAIFVCEQDKTLETIGQVEVVEGLPHPMYKGGWAKINNRVSRMSQFWVTFNNPDQQSQAIEYCKQSGLGIFYLPFWMWEGTTANTVSSMIWPGGKEGLRAFSDVLASNGLLLGLHCNTATLKNLDSQYVSPVPDERLASWGGGKLTQSISNVATEIYFIPSPGTVPPVKLSTDPAGLRPPIYGSVWNFDCVQIGNELIRYATLDTSGPIWCITGCQRGTWGTSAQSHNANDFVKGLLVIWGDNPWMVAPAVDPDTSLLPEIMTKLSDVVNYCKVSRLAFDAQESISTNGKWSCRKALKLAYDGFDHFVAADGSASLVPYQWHILSYANNGEIVDIYDQVYFEEYLVANVRWAQAGFAPGGFGLFSFRIAEDGRKALSPDELEWFLAKTAAYDACYFLETSVDRMNAHGQTAHLLSLCKKWENIRLANVLAAVQKDQMKQFDMNYRLTSSDESASIWQITPMKITTATMTPNGSVLVDNPFVAQPLRFEIEVLGPTSLSGLSMSTGLGTLSVSGSSIPVGNYLVYESGATATVLNANRVTVGSRAVTLNNWQKNAGTSLVTVNASGATKPSLKIMFKTLGTAFDIPNPISNPADINKDSVVDHQDFVWLARQWLATPPGQNSADIFPQTDGGDGQINTLDLIYFANNWLWSR